VPKRLEGWCKGEWWVVGASRWWCAAQKSCSERG
jgi:hypothetical protein